MYLKCPIWDFRLSLSVRRTHEAEYHNTNVSLRDLTNNDTSKKYGLSGAALSEAMEASDHLIRTGTAGAAPIFTK